MMLCYVRLFPTQWLPRLVTVDFCYRGASSKAITPLQVCQGYTRRVCFYRPRSGSVWTDWTSIHSSLAILVHSLVLGLSCSSDYLSFKWSCVHVCAHICCVCVLCVCVSVLCLWCPSPFLNHFYPFRQARWDQTPPPSLPPHTGCWLGKQNKTNELFCGIFELQTTSSCIFRRDLVRKPYHCDFPTHSGGNWF